MKRNKTFAMTLGLTLSLLGATVLFQNCSRGFASRHFSDQSDSSSGVVGFFGNASLDSRCASGAQYDACLFLKNPVTQKGSALSDPLTDPALGGLQILGVKLNLDNSGFLQNSSLQVQSATGGRISPENGSWKFSFADSQHRLAHISAFYWLDTAIQTFKKRTGIFYAEGKNIRVNIDSRGTGWSSASNQISLEAAADGRQVAYDAGILIQLLGEANIYYATQGAIALRANDQNHLDCGPSDGPVRQKNCCVSAQGCSRAITSGASDYLAALMFPDSPTLGEYWANQDSGLSLCRISRDLRLNTNILATDAFQACSGFGATGEVYVMGTVYASIWWEVRQKVLAAGADGNVATALTAYDQLYMQHLALLDSQDTFSTVLTKIQTLDSTKFSSQFSALFTAEFKRRGI